MAHFECTPEMREDKIGWKVQVTVFTTWIPLLMAVAARIVIRQCKRLKFGLDDYLMLAALIPISLGSIFHLIAVSHGLGQHTACLSEHQLSEVIKWQDLGEGMNILSIWLIKLSICFFLLRMIERAHRKARSFIWTLIVLNTGLQLVAFTVCWAAAKTPIWAWWDFNIKPHSDFTKACFRYDQAVFIVNVVIDFIFAFSPLYFLWDVQIPKHQKYTLWSLLLLAILPSIAGVLKVVYMGQVVNAVDPTYAPIRTDDIVALVEQNAGAFVANLPCLNVLLGYVATVVSRSYSNLLSRTTSRSSTKEISRSGSSSGNDDISITQPAFGGVSESSLKTHEIVNAREYAV